MSSTTSKKLDTLTALSSFILEQLKAHKSSFTRDEKAPPLVVGIQGPQGCGKSYLTSHLPAALSALSPTLRTATLSLDDLYLPHSSLVALTKSHPNNKLLHGRGQPGTHDLLLGTSIFKALKSGTKNVELPIFDKSLFKGEGDRVEETVSVSSGVDVVIFEGWMVGFGSITTEDLRTKYSEIKQSGQTAFFLQHPLENLEEINERLKQYERELWKEIDCFVMLKPEALDYVWEWRLEQEHAMKAKNGGIGMSDEEVKAFIGRYMPGYELFQDGICSNTTPWKAKGLELSITRERGVDRIATF